MRKARLRNQSVLVLSETNSVARDKVKAGLSYAVSPETYEAWGLDSNQQFIDDKSKQYVQVISRRDFAPIRIFDIEENKDNDSGEIVGGNLATIASLKFNEELARKAKKGHQNSIILWLGIIALIFAILISLLVLRSSHHKVSILPHLTASTLHFQSPNQEQLIYE